MTESVTVEHYHDLGKWLFGFVFFWGYIAFSQFMLQWYGNLPEETQWYARRGSETATELTSGGWGWVSVLLLFGHFLIPFSGLLSRWMKRWLGFLLFWAVWLLIFHFLDVAWLVMPELGGEAAGGAWAAVAAALCGVVGVGGIWVAGLMYLAGRHMLTPAADPRLDESLAFQNF